MDGLGMVKVYWEPKDVGEAQWHSVRVFPTDARLDANFENNTMKRMLRQDWFLLFDF